MSKVDGSPQVVAAPGADRKVDAENQRVTVGSHPGPRIKKSSLTFQKFIGFLKRIFSYKNQLNRCAKIFSERSIDVKKLQGFVDDGLVDLRSPNGATALIALSKGKSENVEGVKLLIEAGANLKIKDREGKNALARAIENGHVNTLSVLLEAGADIRTLNADEYRRLGALIVNNRPDLFVSLIQDSRFMQLEEDVILDWVENDRSELGKISTQHYFDVLEIVVMSDRSNLMKVFLKDESVLNIRSSGGGSILHHIGSLGNVDPEGAAKILHETIFILLDKYQSDAESLFLEKNDFGRSFVDELSDSMLKSLDSADYSIITLLSNISAYQPLAKAMKARLQAMSD